MIKKSLMGAAFAALCFSMWAQAPQTMSPDYRRTAMHYMENDKQFVNSDVFFKLTSSDRETGLNFVEFSVDDSAFMMYNNPFHLLEEGRHEISYRGFDNSRNLEIAKTFAVIVDNTAPETHLNTIEPLYRKGLTTFCSANTKWYVAAEDDVSGSGTAGTYIGIDINSLALRGMGKESEDAYYSLAEEGPAKIYYTSLDNVGNRAPIALVSVTVDTTAPTVFLEDTGRLINKETEYTVFPGTRVQDEEGRIIVSTKDAIAFGADDGLSGVQAIYVKINDDDYVKYLEPIQFAAETVYNVEVKAVDNVGNMSEPVAYQFYVDKITPASDVLFIDKDGKDVDARRSAQYDDEPVQYGEE